MAREIPSNSKEMDMKDSEGRIKDPELARDMAEAEDPYRSKKRFFGILGPSKENLESAERESLRIESRERDEKRALKIMQSISDSLNKKLKERGVDIKTKVEINKIHNLPSNKHITVMESANVRIKLGFNSLLDLEIHSDSSKLKLTSPESFLYGYNIQPNEAESFLSWSKLDEIENHVNDYAFSNEGLKYVDRVIEGKKKGWYLDGEL